MIASLPARSLSTQASCYKASPPVGGVALLECSCCLSSHHTATSLPQQTPGWCLHSALWPQDVLKPDHHVFTDRDPRSMPYQTQLIALLRRWQHRMLRCAPSASTLPGGMPSYKAPWQRDGAVSWPMLSFDLEHCVELWRGGAATPSPRVPMRSLLRWQPSTTLAHCFRAPSRLGPRMRDSHAT